jgi:hypothetical protein
MSALNNSLMLGQEGGGGYAISRSVRLNSADSAFFSRTPSSAGNRKTWTWAGWVKRSGLGALNTLFETRTGASDSTIFALLYGDGNYGTTKDALVVARYSFYNLITSQVFRDASAWYHIVLATDTTQATASNRLRLYVNGSQVTSFSSATYPTLNEDLPINATASHSIGAASYFSGCLADIHFCDGTAYDASAFGEFDANGIWQPKQFAGVYGTNGFKLNFSDNSTAAALGTDTSGAGNTWTVNNLSVTAGAGNDSLVDVPVNGSQTDTGVGAEVRGNYTVLNALNKGSNVTLTNGNLESSHAGSSVHSRVVGTIGVSSGKWYYEATLTALGGQWPAVGVALSKTTDMATYVGAESGTFGYYAGGGVNGGGGGRTYSSYTTGDVIGVAIDLDNNRLTFYKNGANAVTSGTTYESLTAGEVYVSAVSGYGSSAAWVCNFGQRPFAYTAPSGFKALCTANLPAPVITKPNTVMDVKVYPGNGSTQTISGFEFSPGFVWLKNRSAGDYHRLNDIIRGANRHLFSNTTDAEVVNDANGYLSAFTSNGFSLTSGTGVNASGNSYAAWCWDAGSSTVTDNTGSIQSSRRTNALAGISIVGYTGNGTAGATVGHGLGVAPAFFVIKKISATSNWTTYHQSLGAGGSVFLNLTDAYSSDSTRFNNTAPSSTVVTLGAPFEGNTSGATYVMYCFAPVAGYASMGSFVANANSDGPFVYTSFKPRLVLCKLSSASGADWLIFDTARSPYNVVQANLRPNTSGAEESAFARIDILSNGFKVRAGSGVEPNGTNGNTYIYAAWAESPFNYSRAA